MRLSWGERAFYHRYGGVALGLRLLSDAVDHVDGLTTPRWTAIEVNSLLHGSLPADSSRSRRLTALEGRRVALKFSGSRESFSTHVSRGANSSTRGPGPFVSERDRTLRKAEEAVAAAPDGTRAIILQEMVSGTPPFYYATVHASLDRVVIEARDEQDVAILESTHRGSWFETRGVAAPPKGLRAEFEAIATMHRRLVALFGFQINTEGFRQGGQFVGIQLRPVPQDLPIDSSLTAKVWQAATHSDAFVTHFAYGPYSLRGVVSRQPDVGATVGLFTEPPRSAHLSEVSPYIRPEDLRVLETKWPLAPAVWLSAANVAAERASAAFLALDGLDAFHLSHDVVHLPPVGRFRDNLKYAACRPILDALADGSEIEAVSDGNYAVILRVG